MPEPAPALPHPAVDGLTKLQAVIRQHWGFDTLRPLQQDAMMASLRGRDALMVLPTGGGKSLCYQAPALLKSQITVVVSPLISLMKDQVDSLIANGAPARQMNSSQSPDERSLVLDEMKQGKVRLLFVSPERLVVPSFQQTLRDLGVRSFAIDEAHCISHWGHDFRPEYRQLSQLKANFPGCTIHAFTATATQQVRQDIVQQLALKDPLVLIGSFDRPNLTYRVVPRHEQYGQTEEVIKRHAGEAGIVYCIRRRDVDDMTTYLRSIGYNAEPYHAGLSPEQRKKAQDAFAEERCNLVVATVAFGMGIDRSNIRFVVHTGMPKSIEHYQQETGRAGRDSLEAECVLLYSFADCKTWESILSKPRGEEPIEPEYLEVALFHVREMDRFARGTVCRHKALVEYFNQRYAGNSCGACDVCLEDCAPVTNGHAIAQKVLSCVARVRERFGMGHVTAILLGDATEKVVKNGHDKLSTFGLLKEHSAREARDWIGQLVSQKLLVQTEGEYPILQLNDASWQVMRGDKQARLLQRIEHRRARKSRVEADSWEGVDQGLFQSLRKLRRELAELAGVPPYIIFGDTTLREIARVRPSTVENLLECHGIGTLKARDYGETIVNRVNQYCAQNGLTQDCGTRASRPAFVRPPKPLNPIKAMALQLIKAGRSIEEIQEKTNRAHSTIVGYVVAHVQETKPDNIRAWVPDSLYREVEAMIQKLQTTRASPLYEAFGERIPYDCLRLVAAHLRAHGRGPVEQVPELEQPF